MSKLTCIKWVSSNLPVIILNDSNKQLHLSKQELKDLRDEITKFINFYKEDFEESNISLGRDFDDWHEFTKDKNEKKD